MASSILLLKNRRYVIEHEVSDCIYETVYLAKDTKENDKLYERLL